MAERRLLTVIGTRPQYIKLAALFPHAADRLAMDLIDTGQHYSDGLSAVFRREYKLPEAVRTLSTEALDGPDRLAVWLRGLHTIIDEFSPAALLCFGDTDSALAASLAAVKSGIPVIHVEAGERSRRADGNRVHPASIPEEANRLLIDQTAALLLCATEHAREQCEREGCLGKAVFTGDIMYDLFLRSQAAEEHTASSGLNIADKDREHYFATLHRQINTDDRARLTSLLATLNSLDAPVLLPLHPRTGARIREFDLRLPPGSLHLIEPLSHAETLRLLRRSRRVLTDSGGLTREAYFCGIPSICLDDSTPWFELVRLGWCHLAGADDNAIRSAVDIPAPEAHPALFGNGRAAEAVIDAIADYMG
jgi:UDP-N-acetylglucosamine 2-epimerase